MSEIEQTLEQRGKKYGTFIGQSALSQQLKSVMQSHKSWAHLDTDQKEALEMIQHKIARILNGDASYDDNWRDIAGYSTLVLKRLNGEIV